MDFYQTITAAYAGEIPSQVTVRTLKNGIKSFDAQGVSGEGALEQITANTSIPLSEAEQALFSAVESAAPYACGPKTRESAGTWLKINPQTSLKTQWKRLGEYDNEKSCCNRCVARVYRNTTQ